MNYWPEMTPGQANKVFRVTGMLAARCFFIPVSPLEILLSLTATVLGVSALVYNFRYHRLRRKHKAQDEATKEQFYEIVHELRAPLTAVRDAATMLNEVPSKLSSDDERKMLNLIKTECVRLLDQVSSFLDASKVMSNKLVIQKTPNDLKNLLQEKVLMFSPQAKTTGLELVSDIDPQMSQIMYDPKYIGQVLNNLISNSLKYTPQGGTITVSAKTVDNKIVVSVFDNGLGIPDEKKKALFTKFASINEHNSAISSSGLGLYVAKGIIEAHGGKVSVETHEGRGYKVSFTLPLQALPASLA